MATDLRISSKHLQTEADRQLRASGVRVTASRLDVLSVLLRARRALTHQEIHDDIPELDRVTLYRTLDCLTEHGITHKISGDDRVFRYASLQSTVQPVSSHQHSHFKCTRCAQIFCLDESLSAKQLPDTLNASLQAILGTGYVCHELELTIKGWCRHCAGQSE